MCLCAFTEIEREMLFLLPQTSYYFKLLFKNEMMVTVVFLVENGQ